MFTVQRYVTPLLFEIDALGTTMPHVRQCTDICRAGFMKAQEYYAFPTLEQLANATDEALRADGYGYRAKVTGQPAALFSTECVWRCFTFKTMTLHVEQLTAERCARSPPQFIVGSAAMLLAKEGGGGAWLGQLRETPYEV